MHVSLTHSNRVIQLYNTPTVVGKHPGTNGIKKKRLDAHRMLYLYCNKQYFLFLFLSIYNIGIYLWCLSLCLHNYISSNEEDFFYFSRDKHYFLPSQETIEKEITICLPDFFVKFSRY